MPSPVAMASGDRRSETVQHSTKKQWVCEICWEAKFHTYEETAAHEQTCDNNQWILQSAATTETSSMNISRDKPPKQKKSKKSKTASTSSYSSAPDPVPLMCSITKAIAQKLPQKLNDESDMLLNNLELYQELDTRGKSTIYVRCSNCCAHSIRLMRTADLESTVVQFREHFFNCSNTMKIVRDFLDPNRGWEYRCADSLEEYCTRICDLYGLVDVKTGAATGNSSSVMFNECKYTLVPGYRPYSVLYETVLDRKQRGVATTLSKLLTDNTTEISSSSLIHSKNKLILSDYDHFVLNQFQFICDRIKKKKAYDDDGKDSATLQNYCRIQVCCKHCQNCVEEISSSLDFITSKPFTLHIGYCRSCPTTLIEKINELALLKEKQLKDITSIVPLKTYTLKIIREMYMILDSKHGGLVIPSNPFPDLIAQYTLSMPFYFPLIEDKWVQSASAALQTHPSSTSSEVTPTMIT